MACNLTPNLRAEVLIEALPHIQRFRGQTFVIKYGGSSMDVINPVEHFLRDIVFLEVVGINPVLVHGGGKAITAAMSTTGIAARFVGGLRVTDEKSISIVEKVLDTEINPRLVSTILNFGGRAVGLSGKSVFQAKPLPPPVTIPTDHWSGFVGEIEEIQTETVELAINKEAVPVISPLGSSREGGTLNINADIAASALASTLKASKLIFVSDVPGIMWDPSLPHSLIPSVTCGMATNLIENKVISEGMIPKVQSAVHALQGGVSKVHLVSGFQKHCLLLEIFSNAGIGTEIIP